MIKFFDDKGRIFGKINIIDFAVILFIIFLLPMFYFGYNLFHKEKPLKKIQYKATITVDGLIYNPSAQVLGNVRPGDTFADQNGVKIAEIIKVNDLEKVQRRIKIGYEHQSIEQNALFVIVKLFGSIKNENFIFNKMSISDKRSIPFRTYAYTTDIHLKEKSREEICFNKTIKVKVRIKTIAPEVASVISAGDKETMFCGTNENAVTIGEVASIISKKKHTVTKFEKRGLEEKNITDKYPDLIDIELILNLKVLQKNDGFYYKNSPIRIGKYIQFQTLQYEFGGLVLSLK